MTVKRFVIYLNARWREASTRLALITMVVSAGTVFGFSISDAEINRYADYIGYFLFVLSALFAIVPDEHIDGKSDKLSNDELLSVDNSKLNEHNDR